MEEVTAQAVMGLYANCRRCGQQPERKKAPDDYRYPDHGELWKLHAAMNLEPGDEILCPTRTAIVVDPQWPKWTDSQPFAWGCLDALIN